MKNKLKTEGIDEEFLLSTFRDRDIHSPRKEERKEQKTPVVNHDTQQDIKAPVIASNTNEPKSSTRRKKGSVNYGDIFFKRNEFKTRQCVYISQRNHKIISAVVRMLGDKKITVGGYIDLILSEHLEQYKDEIIEAYQKWKEKEESDLSGLL